MQKMVALAGFFIVGNVFGAAKSFTLEKSFDSHKRCVYGVAVEWVEMPKTGVEKYSDAEKEESVRHPFLSSFSLPKSDIEIRVSDVLVKSKPHAVCRAVDENRRTYRVTHIEGYDAKGEAYNAVADRAGIRDKFQVTFDLEGDPVSAYETHGAPAAVFYRFAD